MMTNCTYRLGRWPAALTVLAGLACSEQALTPSTDLEEGSQAHRVTVFHDSSALSGRIHHMDLELPVVGDPVDPVRAPARAQEPVRLAQIARVDAPEIDGLVLQATHLDLLGDLAFVGYALQGERARGALDAIVDVEGNRPRLASSALFKDSEVNGVLVEGGLVYLATAVEDGAWDATAAVETVRLREARTFSTVGSRVALPSFAGTGLARSGSRLFAVSGDQGGGLTVMDTRSLRKATFDAFDDGRAVVVNGDLAVVLTGTPGSLRVYSAGSGRWSHTIDLAADLAPHAQAGLDLAGGVAAVAAGHSGVKVVHLRSGRILGHLPFPEVPGIDSTDVVANGVAIHGSLIFVAAGGAGLRVAQAARDLEELGPGDDAALTWVGTVEFEDRTSVNFVARRNNRLFVAGGSGGLRVVAFKH